MTTPCCATAWPRSCASSDAGAVVLQAVDGAHGLALAAEHADLGAAWIDLRMAGMAGTATVAQLRLRHPALPVIVLSSSEDPDDVRRALRAGAKGYCPKSAGPGTLLAALRLVLAGEVYVPPFMADAPPAPADAVGPSGLTACQLEVLQLLRKGQANKAITGRSRMAAMIWSSPARSSGSAACQRRKRSFSADQLVPKSCRS